jgi:hypothetical protein
VILTRRGALVTLCAIPLAASGCRGPETPLAHLYGQGWVHGAYELYGTSYHDLQTGAEQKSEDAYRVLAQKGVVALDGLQLREVPFHIHVDPQGSGFAFERDLPDVLTFRADMNDADRKAATTAWEKAREHIHTDYAEIKRLTWALTRLLQQLQRVRSAIENTRSEQFRLTEQIGEVGKGTLPFPLPYEVTAKDYETVLFLLIERLEDDKKRLEALESDIVAVGLTARATDAGSASLAANIRRVLVAVVADSSDAARPVAFPADAGERDKLVARGRDLMQGFLASGEYAAWVKKERDRKLEQVGSLLSIVDRMTGLPASKVYKAVLDVWGGADDYLTYLKVAASFAPGGSEVSKALLEAVGLTEKVRNNLRAGKSATASVGDALLNRGTEYASRQLDKQLAFFRNEKDMNAASKALEQTGLMKDPLPKALDAAESAVME